MLTLIALVALGDGPSIADLDKMAVARDVAGISKSMVGLPAGAFNPVTVVRTNGPYETGRFGWHAFELKAVAGGGEYVVLSTPLAAEDVGELLLRRDGDSLRYVPEDDDFGVRPLRNDLDVTFDVPNKVAGITDSLNFVVKDKGTGANSAPTAITFRLSPHFTVASVVDKDGQSVPFSQAGGVVLMHKPAAGEQTYRISYSVKVDLPDYAGSISADEATLANDYWYPMIARQPAPYQVTCHAPKGWTVVGQGVKESDDETAEAHVVTYRMDLPCVYYSLSAGTYKTESEQIGGRTFYCWSPRMTPEQMRAQLETYPSIISFYERFCKFPFMSYGALDSPHYGGGALEAYSYATYGGGMPYEDAHEPSHTWWGGIVNNTYLHSFWNESFADFCDGMYHREANIGNVLERRETFVENGGTQAGYDEFACANAGVTDGPQAGNIGYGKGAQVLQMLEQLMGTSAIIEAMHQWATGRDPTRGGEWEDFEKLAEDVRPDLHLESFFADWLDRPGHVDFDASVSYTTGTVTVDLKYKGQPFRIPLDVLLVYANGAKKLEKFDVSKDGPLVIASDAKPAVVSLDPYRRLIRRIDADETPVQLNRYAEEPHYNVGNHPNWFSTFGSGSSQLPSDLSGAVLVGSPEDSPKLIPLFAKAGFVVKGNKLTVGATTIDLDHGAAEAVVDAGNGKPCVIAIGSTRIRPNPGRARLALFDDLGRVIRARTEPKTSGHLTYRLP